MYEGIKDFLKNVGNKEDRDIISFYSGRGYHQEILVRLERLMNAIRSYNKHSKSKSDSNNWEKRKVSLLNKVTRELSQLLVVFIEAHTYQITLFKYIYRAYMMKEKDIKIKAHETSEDYLELLKNLDFLDSTNKEQYVFFNKIRNTFIHSSFSRMISFIDIDFQEDFIELITNISEENNLQIKIYKEYIDKVHQDDISSLIESHKQDPYMYKKARNNYQGGSIHFE